jgi:hypothetical protein
MNLNRSLEPSHVLTAQAGSHPAATVPSDDEVLRFECLDGFHVDRALDTVMNDQQAVTPFLGHINIRILNHIDTTSGEPGEFHRSE